MEKLKIEHEAAKAKATMTYNAAADYFDHPVSSFWHRFGQKTIDRIGLEKGQSVLDVCSGSGGSALPAAELVGSNGKVIAVDLAGQLIALAEAKATASQLEHMEFRVADMLELGYPDAHFDAVVCVFGIFFVPDMHAAIKELWRMIKPGGHLAITTWGPDLFEPASSMFWQALGSVRPDLKRSFNPWDLISDPAGLQQLFDEAGVPAARITEESGAHALQAAEDWWKIALGSGYRDTLDQLDAETLEQVRIINLSRLDNGHIKEITTNVLYAVAKKT